jgi:hypothetical protein
MCLKCLEKLDCKGNLYRGRDMFSWFKTSSWCYMYNLLEDRIEEYHEKIDISCWVGIK